MEIATFLFANFCMLFIGYAIGNMRDKEDVKQ